MQSVLTAADVRRQDDAAVAAGTAVETLMGRAGWAVARAAREMLGGLYGRRVVVVCGKGNNGGDGIVAARLLLAGGARACVVLLADRAAVTGATAAALEQFAGPLRTAAALADEVARADLVIDAIVGVGINGPLREETQAVVDLLNDARMTLSIDVPAGVAADTGVVAGRAVRANRTVAIGGLKPGLLFEPGRTFAGMVTTADIGLGADGATAWSLEATDVARAIPRRMATTHKRSAGTVLVVAGSDAMPGAAALVTGAAVHAGAGLTRLCSTPIACAVALSSVPEATSIPAPGSDGALDRSAIELVAEAHADALVIGPGLGASKRTAEVARAIIAEAPYPVVIDADAITAIAGVPELVAARTAPTIITPHAGELARLLGASAADLDADRLEAAREAARRFGCIVVFKGPGTVIAGPNAIFVTRPGGPALAQGGSGDVLAGLLGGWIAQLARTGAVIDERTVAAAVWVHASAGDAIAARSDPHPANATALIAQIGPTMHAVMHS